MFAQPQTDCFGLRLSSHGWGISNKGGSIAAKKKRERRRSLTHPIFSPVVLSPRPRTMPLPLSLSPVLLQGCPPARVAGQKDERPRWADGGPFYGRMTLRRPPKQTGLSETAITGHKRTKIATKNERGAMEKGLVAICSRGLHSPLAIGSCGWFRRTQQREVGFCRACTTIHL